MAKHLLVDDREFDTETRFGGHVAEWYFDYRLGTTRDGRLVIRELHIKPLKRSLADAFAPVPQGGITARLLRRLPLGAELRYARTVVVTQDPSPTPKGPADSGTRRRPGRPASKPLSHYKRVSDRYKVLAKARAPHPAKTLAEEFGYTRDGMRAVLYRCRNKLGLLPRVAKRMGAGKSLNRSARFSAHR